MKYVANIDNWIPDWLIEDLKNKSQGYQNPTIITDWSEESRCIPQKWVEHGYDLSRVKFVNAIEDQLVKKITLPLIFKNVIEVWFSKLEVGDIFPLHEDAYKYDHKKIERYWVALSDWKPGHIFQCGDVVLTNYQKGDVFKFNNSKDLHGACNFGFEVKLSMQISCLITEHEKI